MWSPCRGGGEGRCDHGVDDRERGWASGQENADCGRPKVTWGAHCPAVVVLSINPSAHSIALTPYPLLPPTHADVALLLAWSLPIPLTRLGDRCSTSPFIPLLLPPSSSCDVHLRSVG